MTGAERDDTGTAVSMGDWASPLVAGLSDVSRITGSSSGPRVPSTAGSTARLGVV
jgi:hypothetical protein